MANPWDADAIVAPAAAPAAAPGGAMPWASDEVVTPAQIPPTEEGFGQMVAGARPAAQPAPAPQQPVAGLPVPGYPGQFSQGPQAAPAAPTGQQYNAAVDEYGRPIPGTEPVAIPPIPAPVRHIAGAVGSAFAGPYGPSDEAMGSLVNGPNQTLNGVNRLLVGGGGMLLDAASRPIIAAARGAGAAASEGAQALGMGDGMAGRLERDISQLPDALAPMMVPGSSGMPRIAEAPRADPHFAIANQLDSAIANDVRGPGRGPLLLNQLTELVRKADEPPVEVPRNALMPDAPAPRQTEAPRPAAAPADPAVVQPGMAAPEPVAPAPAPNSVGAAATPGELTNMPPREAAVQQARAEAQRLNDPVKTGVDKTEYVPGVRPTMAEVAGNADVSGEQKYVTQTPGQTEKFVAQQRANNEARLEHYDNLSGDAVTVERLRETRGEQADKDLAAAWGSKAPTDATPVIEGIDQALAGPKGKLSAVSGALKKVRELLYDADGKLETDPEVLYGARREVSAMLGKAAQLEKPTLKDAARELQDVKDHLDAVIESGAPGYKKYLENYSTASRPIDVHELLQGARAGLTNGAERQMSFAKVDSLMKKIVADRQKPGSNPAKSIDEATMEGLFNLHADLRRLNNLSLGKAAGSDTSSLMRIGGALGEGAAHAILGNHLPIVGNMLVKQGADWLRKSKTERRVNELLDGSSYKPKGAPTP